MNQITAVIDKLVDLQDQGILWLRGLIGPVDEGFIIMGLIIVFVAVTLVRFLSAAASLYNGR